jgi:hypothetical protein
VSSTADARRSVAATMIRGVHHEGSVVRNSGRPGLRIGLVALWALLQTPRVTGWSIAADARAGRAAEAWLYSGMVDVVIGVSAPVIAYLLWRRRGPWIWLVAVVWFTISIFDHTVAFANALATAIPTDFLGGNQPTVVTSLVIGAILDAAAIAALASRALRAHYVGTVRPGQAGPAWVRTGVVALSVWAVLQIPRFIAIPVIGDALAEGGPTAWLGPAIGDIIIAAPAAFIAYALWRKTTPWLWVTTVVWLVASIVDHLDTITAATSDSPIPETFAGTSIPAWAAPTIQGGIDVVFLAFLLLTAVRSHYLNIDPPDAQHAHT